MIETFATGLKRPFGIAFYPSGPDPKYVYVANTDSVVRFPYKNGDLKASAAPEVVVAKLPSGAEQVGGGGPLDPRTSSFPTTTRPCSSRSARGRTSTTIPEKIAGPTSWPSPPKAKNERIFASGIRNAVGLAVHPVTGELWCSVNERDGLGDHLVPDYVTHVQEGGFYGWPWWYMGDHQDPRHVGKHPELKDKTIVPDVLLQSHSASLAMDVLHRPHLSRRLRASRGRRRARVVEPSQKDRLQGDPDRHERRKGDRRV